MLTYRVYRQRLIAKFWRVSSEQARGVRADLAAKKTIDTLMRGLIEADQELVEAEKKVKRVGDSRRSTSAHTGLEESRKVLNETFLTTQHARGALTGGTVFDLQTMDRGRGSSSLRISKSKR